MQDRSTLSLLSLTTAVAATRPLALVAIGCGLLACVTGTDAVDEQPTDDVVECTSDDCGGPYGQAAVAVTYYSSGDSTNGWETYDADPAGGSVSVVSDPARGSVIQTVSTGTRNGFRLRKSDLQPWGNTTQFNLEWWQKFSTPFVIYVSVNTNDGHRYLQYTSASTDQLGTGQYIFLGLGSSASDGTWRQFRRDLQADLKKAQPSLTLLSVNAFLVRGSGNLDDIGLSSPTPALAPGSDEATQACVANSDCDSSRLCWQGFCRLKQKSFHPGTCTAHACYPDHLPTANKRCVDLGYLRATSQLSQQVAGDRIWVGWWDNPWRQAEIGGGRAMVSVTCTRFTVEEQLQQPAICRRVVQIRSLNCGWEYSHTWDEDWTGKSPSSCTPRGEWGWHYSYGCENRTAFRDASASYSLR